MIYRIIFFISIFTISCVPVKVVSTQRINKTDQDNIRTFAFGEITKRVKVNRANSEKTEDYIRRLVVENMERRGLKWVEKDPDILLDLSVFLLDLEREERSQTRNYGFSRRWYYYRPGWNDGPIGDDYPDQGNFTASISLLIGESEAKVELWKGTAEAQLSRNAQKGAARLQSAIDQLLNDFEGKG